MNYRRMGRSGLKLSEIALGSWMTAGNAVEEKTAIGCIRRAIELGINYLDSADVYAQRRAEQVTSRAIEPFRREDLVLASKCFFPASENVLDRGLSRQHIHTSVHKTLKSFRSDYVDIFYCHRFDPDVPLDEIVRTFDDLIRAGKVLYWGVSEWPAEQIEKVVALAGRTNACAPSINQPQYSLLKRDIEASGVMDACARHGLGIAAFSPLAQGVLTGKYRGLNVPRDSRLADPRQNAFMNDLTTGDVVARVERFAGLAQQAGLTMTQLALGWCLRRPEVTCALVGASRIAQVEENAAAVKAPLPADVVAALERD